ncbi:MAG: YfhO family protein [Nitrospinota bacterium]|nr:YfhO family protein [Nitrospinota bacterium]
MWRNIYENPVAITLKNQTEGTRFLAKNGFPLHANFGLIYRMSNTAGYNPFRLKGYGKLNLDQPEIASLLGTKFVDFKYLETLGDNWKNEGAFKLKRGFMENKHALPRAFFIQKSRFEPSFDLPSSVKKGEFEPQKLVYLDKEFPNVEGEILESVVTRYQNTGDEIEVDLTNATPGFLFVSEVYYPGWRASVNGKDTVVLRANQVFCAVRLESPSGKGSSNRIKFTFQPRSFTLGACVSTAAFLSMALFWMFSIFKIRFSRES